MKIPKITEEQFKTYEAIRESGACNMFSTSTIQKIAITKYHVKLKKEDVFEIMRKYLVYKDTFKLMRDKRLEKLNHGKL